jgi:Ca2+-binding EF-hand superfamily protein
MTRKNDVTILREYMKQKHVEQFRIDYVTNNYAFEGRQLKAMIAEYGFDVVKRFIDECFREYKPTRDYPGLNFAFMYSFMRARILPRVLAEAKREQSRKEAIGQQLSEAEFNELI